MFVTSGCHKLAIGPAYRQLLLKQRVLPAWSTDPIRQLVTAGELFLGTWLWSFQAPAIALAVCVVVFIVFAVYRAAAATRGTVNHCGCFPARTDSEPRVAVAIGAVYVIWAALTLAASFRARRLPESVELASTAALLVLFLLLVRGALRVRSSTR